MRVLLFAHVIPFAGYRHHQIGGAAPIPVAVREVGGSFEHGILQSCHLRLVALIPDR